MPKYVAMIRGIGPGNPNMSGSSFKSFFEGLGFRNAQAVLASGNVIFESDNEDSESLALLIEKELPNKLGFSRKVIIRSESELQKLIDANIFSGNEDSHNKDKYLLITFFRDLVKVPFTLPYTPENKPYRVLGKLENSVYGVVDLTKTKTPDYMAWLEKQFGKDITSRTPKTIRLILSRMNSSK